MSAPAPPPTRRRARYAVGVALAVLLLGACTGRPPTPTSYGDTTQRNFSRGCLAEARQKDSGISDPEQYCKCVYDKIVDTIPFDRFKEVNSDLSDEPGPLPSDLLKIRDSCVEGLG